jgi:hypothetical protein
VIGRLVFLGVGLLGLVVGLMLLAGVFLEAVVTPRDDAAYPLTTVAQALSGPRTFEVALTDPQGLDGEEVIEGRGRLLVIVSPGPGAESFFVVNATSPIDGERVEITREGLIGTDGTAWSVAGDPVDPADPPLQRFPSIVREGVLIVDFTEPDPPR